VLLVLRVRLLLFGLRRLPVTTSWHAVTLLLLLLLLPPSILSRRLSRLGLWAGRSRAGAVLGRTGGGVRGTRDFRCLPGTVRDQPCREVRGEWREAAYFGWLPVPDMVAVLDSIVAEVV